MFAAWRYEENGLNDWMERKLGPGLSRFVRPVIVTVLDIVAAPIELAERMFYRPNRIKEEIVVEDLRAKSKTLLTQTYLDACTQTFYGDKHLGIKFDPKRTYDRLDSCTSGTFKTVAADAPETVLSQTGLPRQEAHFAPNSINVAKMSDSQTITGRHRSLLVRPFKGEFAETKFGATASGTYFPLTGFHQWQNETAGVKPPENKSGKSGTYPSVPAGENPDGLKQFIKTAENEKLY